MKNLIKSPYGKIALSLITILFLGFPIISAQPIPPGPPPTPMGQTPPPPPGSPAPQGQPLPPPPNPQTPQGWSAPGMLVNPPVANWMNQGQVNVMATGYDSESVLVQIPLVVSYVFNGVSYNVTVLNSWNPFTQSWNIGVDTPAYQGNNSFNGFTYNYFVSLPSGTYYFNL